MSDLAKLLDDWQAKHRKLHGLFRQCECCGQHPRLIDAVRELRMRCLRLSGLTVESESDKLKRLDGVLYKILQPESEKTQTEGYLDIILRTESENDETTSK